MTASGQTVHAAATCAGRPLSSVEREICGRPELQQLNDSVDTLTARLESTLTDGDRDALVDTERPFVVQRNDCQNQRAVVRACVERLLSGRVSALTVALNAPASIRDEITKYSFLTVPFFQKYGDRLVGRRIRVFGCMSLAPGATAAARVSGTISESCAQTSGPSVAALFSSMNSTKAIWFYDAKQPSSYWEGIVERRADRLVLTQIDP